MKHQNTSQQVSENVYEIILMSFFIKILKICTWSFYRRVYVCTKFDSVQILKQHTVEGTVVMENGNPQGIRHTS